MTLYGSPVSVYISLAVSRTDDKVGADDDAYLYTLDNPPAFGTIRLELWEANIDQIVRAPYQHRYGGEVLESQIIHETSKKAGAHHVK